MVETFPEPPYPFCWSHSVSGRPQTLDLVSKGCLLTDCSINPSSATELEMRETEAYQHLILAETQEGRIVPSSQILLWVFYQT